MPNGYTSGTRERVAAHTRFWDLVEKTDGCWLWKGSTASYRLGYGSFHPDADTRVRAHRYSYELHYGRVPDGLYVLHRCDTPACVRPDHLWLGSKAENNSDRALKGRSATGERNGQHTKPGSTARGSQHGMAKLDEATVREIRSRYKPFVVTRAHLTREYGVSRSLIDQIIDRQIWKHV
jgi:hypothetical protein